MASLIPEAIKSATDAVMGSEGYKITDLSKDTKEPTEKIQLTSDYGVKLPNPEHWLSVSSEDRQGPSLIEDPFSREKVRLNYIISQPEKLHENGY